MIFIEPKTAFILENNNVALIKDVSTLGVYTFTRMLIELGVTKGPDLITMTCNQFNLSETEVTDHLDLIIDLGLWG